MRYVLTYRSSINGKVLVDERLDNLSVNTVVLATEYRTYTLPGCRFNALHLVIDPLPFSAPYEYDVSFGYDHDPGFGTGTFQSVPLKSVVLITRASAIHLSNFDLFEYHVRLKPDYSETNDKEKVK